MVTVINCNNIKIVQLIQSEQNITKVQTLCKKQNSPKKSSFIKKLYFLSHTLTNCNGRSNSLKHSIFMRL